MKWVNDITGRFPQRPHYNPEEIDYECENVVIDYLKHKYNCVKFPISTDDLTILIEKSTSDLNLYADLSADGEDVEGATDFFLDKEPAVFISEKLSERPVMKIDYELL
jgi:hypothetical protein